MLKSSEVKPEFWDPDQGWDAASRWAQEANRWHKRLQSARRNVLILSALAFGEFIWIVILLSTR